jgi:hypothetical protein
LQDTASSFSSASLPRFMSLLRGAPAPRQVGTM